MEEKEQILNPDHIEMKLMNVERKNSCDSIQKPDLSTTDPLLWTSNAATNEVDNLSHQPLITINNMDKVSSSINPVKTANSSNQNDRYNLVYIILLLHGIAILMPWNIFINATEYFTEYKLMIHYDNGTVVESKYKEFFLSNLSIASQIPNVLFNVLNIFFYTGGNKCGIGASYNLRILGAIIIELLFIIVTVLLAIVETSKWISTFFYLTMAIVIILNTVNGVYQNSLYGLASRLPMKYTNAIITGNNICGTFIALMNIITIWLSPNIRIATIYFFISAILILIVAFVSFLLLKINRYYRFYIKNDIIRDTSKILPTKDLINEENIENPNLDKSMNSVVNVNSKSQRPPYLYVFGLVWKQCLNVFLVFFVTLSTFPVIQSEIKPINPEYFGSLKNTKAYFVVVCCFLVFNASAMFGNIAPNFAIFPGPDHLWIPVLARFLFIPFFTLCNYLPDRRTWPILIQSDGLYIFGGILMGFSSGYYSSLSMMYAPRSVSDPEHAGIAGMMAAASLVIGIFFGVNFSYVLAWIIRQK